ncbi:trp operon leader peptide [Streptomyces sp. NPDC059786]
MAARAAVRTPRRPGSRCCRAPGVGYGHRMFAHSIQNWWWTAHPAAR